MYDRAIIQTPAKRRDHQNTPLPAERKTLSFGRSYTTEEFARIVLGRKPQEMEDKWFIFYEEPWSYLHRSWTGFCIFLVSFKEVDGQHQVREALVNRDSNQYPSDDCHDCLLLGALLDRLAGRNNDADALMSELCAMVAERIRAKSVESEP